MAEPMCDAERHKHKEDAERPERHADAEHRHDSQLDLCLTPSAGAIIIKTWLFGPSVQQRDRLRHKVERTQIETLLIHL